MVKYQTLNLLEWTVYCIKAIYKNKEIVGVIIQATTMVIFRPFFQRVGIQTGNLL